MTRSEVAALVALLAAAYPRMPVSEATSEVYEAMLGDLAYADAEKAVKRLLCTSKFMPTIAEIRQAVVVVRRGPLRAGIDAWGDVLREIRRVGAYAEPKFSDPVTGECVRQLGWRNLCLEGSNDAADRARFAELYDSIAGRDRTDEIAGLPPRHERALPSAIRELTGKIGASNVR